MTAETILFKKLEPNAEIPRKSKRSDAGYDLRYSGSDALRLDPGERWLAGAGIAVHIPHGYVGYINPRSGRATIEGLSIVNAPGTVDSGYTGELKVNLINLDPEKDIVIYPGEKIAQLVIHPIATLPERVLGEDEELPKTARGASGHGSTGNL